MNRLTYSTWRPRQVKQSIQYYSPIILDALLGPCARAEPVQAQSWGSARGEPRLNSCAASQGCAQAVEPVQACTGL